MEKSKLKIGYVPTRRDLFSREEAIRYKKIIAGEIARPGLTVVDIEDINNEGLLYSEEHLENIISKLSLEKVDALFFPHCNFGTEDLVAKVAKKINVPVLLWGPRDDRPLEDGIRTRDTQCGLFATGKVLRRFKVPFTYLNNCNSDSSYFKSGFDKFLAVSNVIRAFRTTRILQISTRPTGFWSVMINENELLEKFGIQIYPVTLQEVTDRARDIQQKRKDGFISTLQYIRNNVTCKGFDGRGDNLDVALIEKIAALKCSIREFAEDYKCNAAAIQCWSTLQNIYGIMPCLTNSLLADEGFPCVCETDINGAVSAVMLQAACRDEKPHFFGDVTVRHPDNPNAELLWHCGPFPLSLAKDPKAAWVGNHWILNDKKFGTCEWEIKGGDITIARFDGDNGDYSLLIGEGKGIDGPGTRGTYVWFEVGNWPKWERKIVKGPYIHHVAGIHDKVGDILLEACNYIPGLEADPAEPSREELEDRWIDKADRILEPGRSI